MKRIAQIAVINRFVGVLTDGPGNQHQGIFRHAGLKGDDAEKMIGVGMIGIKLKGLPVPRFRQFNVAGLMSAKTFLDEPIQPGVLGCLIR